jgi:uncharacterized membrane protein (Fun14 family)
MADKLPDEVTMFIKANMPAAEQLGFGGVMGYCSGMAFRRVGRAVGVVLGIGFMGAQFAASSGYVEIDWEKVKNSAIKPFDTVSVHFWKKATFLHLVLNRLSCLTHAQQTGDGKITEKDAQALWDRYNSVMTDRLPSAGGFAAGFLMGARR